MDAARTRTGVVIPTYFPPGRDHGLAIELLEDTVDACLQVLGEPARLCVSVDGEDCGREIAARLQEDRRTSLCVAPVNRGKLHALRLGDVAICTNPFELFVDYGIQIKARSKAIQTFVIQLACNSGLYLPTPKAVRGGSYSGNPHVSRVGPEGGQVLVEQTVKAINALWKDGKK